MKRQCARSVSLPCESLGYHAKGTVIVRPSSKSTTSASPVTVNRWALASVVSVGDVEVFIPFLHQKRRTLNHEPFDLAQFRGTESAAALEPNGIQPELRAFRITLDVDVTRFVPIRRVEEESKRPVNKNGRHTQV